MHETNYDESKATLAPLPDVLTCDNGRKITSALDFLSVRRPEILRHFEQIMFGPVPQCSEKVEFVETRVVDNALSGLAVRREIKMILTHKNRTHQVDILWYMPKVGDCVPAIININFSGNNCCSEEADIIKPRDASLVLAMGPMDEPSRHAIEYRLKRGYSVITACRGDFFPDSQNGRKDSIYGLFDDNEVSADSGAISAWAFGVMRLVDCLYTERRINKNKIYVHGHSRLGKTALWATANDLRLAGAVSNNSGCCGAALCRRDYGETVETAFAVFPWWFSRKLEHYATRITELPIDQHMLLSLVAPRPLLVASATEDQWADPLGEFLSTVAAQEVYKLFGGHGLSTNKTPNPDTLVVGDAIGYYIRTGKHGVHQSDWANAIDFFEKQCQ